MLPLSGVRGRRNEVYNTGSAEALTQPFYFAGSACPDRANEADGATARVAPTGHRFPPSFLRRQESIA